MKLPVRANRRPWCWRRRLPIPFITLIVDGVPKFVNEDRDRIKLCARKSLCQFCGTPLDALIVFLGGEVAVMQRLFRQAPFHEECASFALTLCPYLNSTSDPQFMVWCRRFEFVWATFPASDGGTTTQVFRAHAIVRTTQVTGSRAGAVEAAS